MSCDWRRSKRPLLNAAFSSDNIINDAWEGVNDFCEALDHIIDCERETDLLIGRSILEIGFASGIPSVFALDSGAESATIHATDPLILDAYIKPTLRRNNVSPMLCKFSTSVWSTTRTTLAGKKYDVILAPELLCVDESQFDALHEILDETLASNGVAFISARIFYPNVTASIPAFMDLLKLRGRFDAFIRWTSRKSLLAPRQLIQLSRR